MLEQHEDATHGAARCLTYLLAAVGVSESLPWPVVQQCLQLEYAL
jgi:hypothetical protein